MLIFPRLLISSLESILRLCLKNAGMYRLKSVRMTGLCFRARKWTCAVARRVSDDIKNFWVVKVRSDWGAGTAADCEMSLSGGGTVEELYFETRGLIRPLLPESLVAG